MSHIPFASEKSQNERDFSLTCTIDLFLFIKQFIMYDDCTRDNNSLQNRRRFISDTLRIAGVSALLATPRISVAKDYLKNKEYSVQDIIDIILKEIPGAPFKQTVDTIKSGSADAKVSGIVTTMFATVDVIKRAAQ